MSSASRAIVGLIVFALAAVWQVPHLLHPAWAHALLQLAALVLAPLLFDLVADETDDARTRRFIGALRTLQLPAALLLVIACALSPGIAALAAASGWIVVLLGLAFVGARRLLRHGGPSLPDLCRALGMVYAAVGALWLAADRVGLRPLGFDEAIVLLTAVHFHYAGLLLPIVAGLALEARRRAGREGPLDAMTGWAVIAGVPGVAVGITVAQLGMGRAVEAVAAIVMACGGAGVAWLQLRLALRVEANGPVAETGRRLWARCLWVMSSSSLLAGMALAALYGLRFFFQPWPWLDVPWMRALHGSINALGFASTSVIGWWLARPTASAKG